MQLLYSRSFVNVFVNIFQFINSLDIYHTSSDAEHNNLPENLYTTTKVFVALTFPYFRWVT